MILVYIYIYSLDIVVDLRINKKVTVTDVRRLDVYVFTFFYDTVECSEWSEGPGFNTRSSHIKD